MLRTFAIALLLVGTWAPLSAQSVQVFVTDSASWEASGFADSARPAGEARPQATEILQVITGHCPQVDVTLRPERAHFVVRIDSAPSDSRIAVANAAGELIYHNSAQVLADGVENACSAILAWVDQQGVPQTFGAIVGGQEGEAQRMGPSGTAPSPFANLEWGARGEGSAATESVWWEAEEEEPPVNGQNEVSQPSADQPLSVAKPAPSPPARRQAATADQPEEEEDPESEEAQDDEAIAWENMVEGGIVVLLCILGVVALVAAIVAAVKRSWSDLAYSLVGCAVVSFSLLALFYKPDFLEWLEYLGSLI
ncbi:MAG TPA: hypothetical protein VLV83_07680 [Acidobacteriota bacterium]|nr:hypothetical protein [Acidobacteriota bacterium]